MNQGQEEKTCCVSRAGIMAWIIHICNIIASLAVCALTFGCLGVLVYVKRNKNEEREEIMKGIIKSVPFANDRLMSLVKELNGGDQRTVLHIFLPSLLSTGMCAMLSATYSFVLLAKPRLHYGYYLSTWLYSGKFLLDGALLFVSYINSQETGKQMVYSFSLLSGLFTTTQLLLHISVTVAISKRDRGEQSCCLPWNATGDGDIQCC